MKKNTLSLFALLACATMVTFTSCVPLPLNEEEETPEEVVVKKVPISIVKQETLTWPYTESIYYSYDGQNRLTEIREVGYSYGSLDQRNIVQVENKQVFEYADATNKPSKGVTTQSRQIVAYTEPIKMPSKGIIYILPPFTNYTTHYSYPDHLTVKLWDEIGNSNFENTPDFLELNDKGQLIKHHSYVSSSRTRIITYEYDKAGNISKESYDDNTSYDDLYTFDNKKGVFSDINAPSWLFIQSPYIFQGLGQLFMANNLLTIRSENATGAATYEYDTDGYPVKITFNNRSLYIDGVSEDDRDEVFVITYK